VQRTCPLLRPTVRPVRSLRSAAIVAVWRRTRLSMVVEVKSSRWTWLSGGICEANLCGHVMTLGLFSGSGARTSGGATTTSSASHHYQTRQEEFDILGMPLVYDASMSI
jgi:hypothetical protein